MTYVNIKEKNISNADIAFLSLIEYLNNECSERERDIAYLIYNLDKAYLHKRDKELKFGDYNNPYYDNVLKNVEEILKKHSLPFLDKGFLEKKKEEKFKELNSYFTMKNGEIEGFHINIHEE